MTSFVSVESKAEMTVDHDVHLIVNSLCNDYVEVDAEERVDPSTIKTAINTNNAEQEAIRKLPLCCN